MPAKAEIATLQNQKAALQFEYDFVRQKPATYYLLIDFNDQKVYLKADANLLRTCQILGSFGELKRQTQLLIFQQHIIPYTPESATTSRQRPLPMDFSGRLTKGPKHRSRLYFTPAFIIQSSELPTLETLNGIQLSNEDVKAISSALTPESKAILLPPQRIGTDPSP